MQDLVPQKRRRRPKHERIGLGGWLMILFMPTLVAAALGAYTYQHWQAQARAEQALARAAPGDRATAKAYGARLTLLIEREPDAGASRRALAQLLELPGRYDLEYIERGERPMSEEQRRRACAFYGEGEDCFAALREAVGS